MTGTRNPAVASVSRSRGGGERRFYAVRSWRNLLLFAAAIQVGAPHGMPARAADGAASPPEFRAILSEDEYAKRRAAALAAAGDLAAVAKSAMPVFGSVISKFEPESSAAAAGMTVGSIVYRQDDELVRWDDFPKAQKEVTLWYFDSKTRRVGSAVARPGAFGIFLENHWRPELLFLRRKERMPRAEPHALVGIVQRRTDPDLAETAWRHALDAGYMPDALSHQCGVEIALAQGRAAEAWRFAEAALEVEAKSSEPVYPVAIYRAALANFQLPAMAKLAERYPRTIGANARELNRLAEQSKGVRAELERLPTPAALADKMYRDDLIPRMQATPRSPVTNWIHGLIKEDPLTFEAATDRRVAVLFLTQEPARNVEFLARFKAGPTSSASGNYSKAVYFVLDADHVDVEDPNDFDTLLRKLQTNLDAPSLLSFSCDAEAKVSIEHSETSNNFAFKATEWMADPEPFHEIRMIVVDGRGEIFLDGKRLAYVPVGREERCRAFCIASIGMKLLLQDVKIVELIEKKD